ncbi:hypothetical protein GCM10027038_22450 [Arthrobacter bambusae]
MWPETTHRTVCRTLGVSETNVRAMAFQKRARGGRPSKGDRHVLTTRLPVADAEKLFAVADHQGQSASEFIAHAVAEKLASIDIATVTGQGELPIGRIAS